MKKINKKRKNKCKIRVKKLQCKNNITVKKTNKIENNKKINYVPKIFAINSSKSLKKNQNQTKIKWSMHISIIKNFYIIIHS